MERLLHAVDVADFHELNHTVSANKQRVSIRWIVSMLICFAMLRLLTRCCAAYLHLRECVVESVGRDGCMHGHAAE